MWIVSLKSYLFIRYCKPIITCVHWQKENLKSHFLAANTPVGIEFPISKLIDIAVSVSKTHLERERFVSAKDKIPRRGKHKKSKS